MPAAAVIPAPIAYIKVVAVKKLVVGFLDGATGLPLVRCVLVFDSVHPCGEAHYGIKLSWRGTASFTVKKLEGLKQAFCCEYISME